MPESSVNTVALPQTSRRRLSSIVEYSFFPPRHSTPAPREKRY